MGIVAVEAESKQGLVIVGIARIDEVLDWRFGQRNSEKLVLQIQTEGDERVNRDGLYALQVTGQTLYLGLKHTGQGGYEILCAEPANTYGCSTHPLREAVYDTYGFSPAEEDPRHGILFAGRLYYLPTGAGSFSLSPGNQPDETVRQQMSFARKHLALLGSYVLNAPPARL